MCHIHRTVVVTPTLFPGTFPPWNSAHPGPKKVTPKTLHHGTPLKTAKCSKHQKLGTYKTQWNTSHTHLERGTCFIILQMGLHDRTAWNAAFTTLNMSCSNLALFRFYRSPWQVPCNLHLQTILTRSYIYICEGMPGIGLPMPIRNGFAYACRKRVWVCLPNPPNGTLDTKGLFWVQFTRRMKWIPMDRYAPNQGLGTCCLEITMERCKTPSKVNKTNSIQCQMSFVLVLKHAVTRAPLQ